MGQTIGRINQQSAVRRFILDDVALTYVVDGSMVMDRERFFASIPEHYWREHPEALTVDGRVAMSAGGLLIERDDRLVLIDAGFGNARISIEFGDIDCGALPDVLTVLGYKPEDIEAVAFTHLHIDHTGWTVVNGDDGAAHWVFPQARYLLSEPELQPHRCGLHPPGSSPSHLLDQLAARATFIGDGALVAEGIEAVLTPGHTAGHLSYIVTSSAGRRMVVFGDVFHIPAQIGNPSWSSGPDLDSTRAVRARDRIISELDQPDTFGFGFHFGDQPFGQIVRDDSGLPRWQPLPTTELLPTPRP